MQVALCKDLDYFLFHVTSNGMVCLKETATCLGHTYAMGTNVFYGFHYEFIKSSKKGCWYKKCNQDNNLIIPAGCVLYVGIDLATVKDSYWLQIEDHQDIMCAIAAS